MILSEFSQESQPDTVSEWTVINCCVHGQGRENIPLPFKVLCLVLRIKLTNGDKQEEDIHILFDVDIFTHTQRLSHISEIKTSIRMVLTE